ncbi:MAG: sodium:calcium antiporter [Herpetosiphonaceae bacterium]|nr:sodium:calcium antiporter [Herpetosiphonaceae bacterium]
MQLTIILSILALVVGLFLIERSAESFTGAVGATARRFHASESVVGLLTAGGEWEELVVVVIALASGHASLAVGNVVGSCLANLLGSMPLGFLGPHPLAPDRSARIYAGVMLVVTALATVFFFGGRVTRAEGGILVGVFLVYVTSVLIVIRKGLLAPPASDDATDDEPHQQSLVRTVGVLVFSLLVISLGAELVVEGATRIARVAGLSEYAIGATVVALGTTLPDKAISLIGGLRGQGGVVTANATGSNIFLLTLVLGISALASHAGLAISSSVSHVDGPLLLAVSVLVTVLFQRRSLHRAIGLSLLTLYLGYLAYALLRGA